MADLPGGTEMAFAPPGVDELAVVTRLITVLRRLAASRPGVPRPALLAFHVGITRIEGDGLGGEAAIRTRTLLLHPAVRGAAGAGAADGSGQLAVIISDWLYADLRAEGLPGEDWMRIPAAGGWLRHCETARSISRNDPAYRASPAR
jgi:hypothetical protein